MSGIKNAFKFLWGVILGMAIVQICHAPVATSGQDIVNGWSFASYGITGISAIFVVGIIISWLMDHWDDDKKK